MGADRSSERGAALLTVLLLVAVIAVLAATALEKLRLATRLGGNAIAMDQARAYGLAAETLALTKVSDLLSRDKSRVTLAGGWSGRAIPLPVPGGLATAKVSDGGNCFNLNSLAVETTPGSYAAFTPSRIQFARLIRLVGGSSASGESIAAAASDWIDTDTSPLDLGAEDSSYSGQAVPYRTANTLMTDPSELRAVAGVTPQIYAKLRPWLCTLPIAKPSKINVNTLLPEQAPLLAMLMPDTMTVEAARQVLLRRPPNGFESTSAFWKLPSLDAVTPPPDAMAQTAVTTGWFSLQVDATVGGAELEEHALIDATELPARLVSRHWGEQS
ncbi:MAG: type II secretion system minor pseudopilin GspK [Candidatus Sphingomonas phytovorans]|nr:type II secretion system minor pseudopilin GspK [Sphingomonas sp.]WEK01615.1 MAG: type II secretion system minor pseudopilin GspK [Sphingomonas sp.]